MRRIPDMRHITDLTHIPDMRRISILRLYAVMYTIGYLKTGHQQLHSSADKGSCEKILISLTMMSCKLTLVLCVLAAIVAVNDGLSHGSIISDLIDFKDDPLQEHDSAAKDEKFDSKKKRFVDGGALIALGVAAGTSLIGTTTNALLSQTGYSVTVGIEMENYSKWLLSDPRAINDAGQISTPPTAVKPRTKETMIAHKTSNAAKGTSGVVSWRFEKGGSAYRILVMWSVPYSQDFHSNWLGLGIRPEESTDPTFDDMYDGTDTTWFARKDFYYDTNTLKFCRFDVCVSGAMGTSHKSKVLVRFIPQDVDDLAPGFKEMISGSK
ncbi:unnamed protein product [Owenia fusiformis]|uniref:Uncharacterized protein n=1 Tax=Owenia fusiformis TaxID=6347 RepID=A0A8J1USC0_OWEFU|nr:unnamed protein product [Owenia fusiformis]